MTTQIPFLLDFNVNHYVRVKLTSVGWELVKNHWVQFGLAAPKPTMDTGGWTRWQLWDLMNIFGPHLYNGCEMPFETTIQIETGQ